MTARLYPTEQFLFAFVRTAAGLAVGVGLVGRWLWSSMDEAVTLPRRAR